MKRFSLVLLALALGAAGPAANLRAQEAAATASTVGAPPADPDLPQPFDFNALQPLLQKSPFNRVVDFAETYQLTGIARVDGKAIATLMHRETKKRYVVSDEPNVLGWRLTDVTGDQEVKTAQIKIEVGSEVVTLRYSKESIQPEANKPSSSSNGRSGWGGPYKPGDPRPDIHSLKDEDVYRKMSDGREYYRGSAYLTDAQYDKYRNSLSREGHDKFREVMTSSADRMKTQNADQRADFSRRVFEKIAAEDSGSPQGGR
jgi:hypothetical protein